MSKKKMLIIGITMNCAGTEKSFLSFANQINYDEFDVDLVLAEAKGPLYKDIPKQINVYEMPDKEHNQMFMLSGKNAARMIFDCFIKKNPLVGFEVLPYFIKLVLNRKNSSPATRMWVKLLQHFTPLNKSYDVAVAYWGDRTMFYMIDKVKAKKKITWLHFDYGNPQRDDETYLKYFSACDSIVTVSKEINDSIVTYFPSLKNKCVTIENINDPEQTISKSNEIVDFDDDYKGKKIVSVGRIAEQKGFDLAIEAMKLLKNNNIDCRLYIIGEGEECYVTNLKHMVKELDLIDTVQFLGGKSNPYPYIRMADIYLQSSRYEGKPITVDEAKILCKPIVATNYVSANEQLENGKLGAVVDISPEGISKAISEILTNDERSNKYIDELKKKDFSNKKEIEKFYKLI